MLPPMADDDELRLNDLTRFRKTSPRLALEAHSHCEVPAGCGGVVLRWRRPDAPIGLSLFKYIAGAAEGFCIDGRAIEEQRMVVDPGEHVLSFVVDDPGDEGFIMMRLGLEPTIVTARCANAVSQTDGRLRAALAPPPDGWRLTGFDDSDFVALVEKAVREPKGNEKWSWQYLQRDAKGLGLPTPDDGDSRLTRWLSALRRPRIERVWVRFTFRVDHEGFA
jgi:hypothetical protein